MSLPATIINLENNNIDLNSLFHMNFSFNYNFDLLKSALELLIKSQKAQGMKVIELEERINKKENKIEEMEKTIIILKKKLLERNSLIEKNVSDKAKYDENKNKKINDTIELNKSLSTQQNDLINYLNNEKINNSVENKENINNSNLVKENINQSLINKINNSTDQDDNRNLINNINFNKNIIDSKDQNILKDNDIKTRNYDDVILNSNLLTEEKNQQTKDDIEFLKIKITNIENQIHNFLFINDEVSEFRIKLNNHDKDLKLHNMEITTNKNDINYLKSSADMNQSKMSVIEKNIEDLNLKMLDFNIFDLFKNKTGIEGGKLDGGDVIFLIQNIEKKIYKKFEMSDEKYKKLEDDSFKIKNDILNLKNEHNTKSNENSNLEEKIIKKMDEIKKNLQNKEESMNNYINDKIKEINEAFNIKFNDIIKKNSEFKEQSKVIKKESNSIQSNIDNESKIQKELIKRISDLEKSFKVFNNTINIELINKDILSLKDLIATKTANIETQEIKQKCSENLGQIEYLKDAFNQINDDRKMSEELSWLRKKIEAITAQLQNIKTNEEPSAATNLNKNFHFDTGKFIDLSTFNEFQKNLRKDIEFLNGKCEEFARLFDEIFILMKNKVTEKEFKTYEEIFSFKLEELKTNCFAKLADKNNTNKNIKYLDAQIKHVIDVYIKKMEKGDNWLLAKKPVGGHSCASCESYIGDLLDHNQHVPWNKMHHPKEIERSYRIGNGFSKMLQMINFDGGKNNKDLSDNEKFNSLNSSRNKVKLPRVKSNRSNNLRNKQIDSINMSTVDYVKTEIEPEYDDTNSPKVMKIYKKKIKKNEIINKILNSEMK